MNSMIEYSTSLDICTYWGVSKLGFCAVYFGNKHCLFENTHVYLEKNTTPSGLGYFPSV